MPVQHSMEKNMKHNAKLGFLLSLAAAAILPGCGQDDVTVIHSNVPPTGMALQENRKPLALKYLAEQGYASIERGRNVYPYNEMSSLYTDCYRMTKAGGNDDGHLYEGCVITDPQRKPVNMEEAPRDMGTRFDSLQVKTP